MSQLRGWTRCPRCGSGLERDEESACCVACGYTAYANPAPALCAFVVDGTGARVLLGRRAREPRAGLWDALGGFAREDEDALDALRRELREEAGAEVEVLEFVGGFADRYGDDGDSTLNFYWVARLCDERQVDAADDVSELRWFPLDELPTCDEIAFPNTARALGEFLRRHRWRGSSRGIFEVQLVTADVERLAQFYGGVLRLQETVADHQRGRVHFGLGRGQLILARDESEQGSPHWPGLPPPLLGTADVRAPTPLVHGAVHFALEVTRRQLFTEASRLEREGLDVRGPFRWPDGFLSVYFHDPDGNVVELIAGP